MDHLRIRLSTGINFAPAWPARGTNEGEEEIMPIETRCSKIIHGFGMFSSVQCSHAMKVMHNDKPYCNKHDPEKVKARRAERDAKWQAKYDEQKRVLADTISLAAALGAGEPEYSTLSGKGRYTGSIVLTADEAQQLIERLTKVKR